MYKQREKCGNTLKINRMKNTIYAACLLTILLSCFNSYAQEYKTTEDTVKLNKEFTEVSNDIAAYYSQPMANYMV